MNKISINIDPETLSEVLSDVLASPEIERLLDRAAERAIRKNKIQEQQYLTAAEAARLLRMTVPALAKARRDGRISGTLRGKSYLFSRTEIERFLNA